MKGMVLILALIGLVAFAMPPEVAAAPDTLDVAALPPGNLNNVINGDTLAGGVRANPDRVYRLNRGSVYQVTEPMKINGSLHIVATAGTNRPPVLAPAILADNSSIDHFFAFIGKGADVSISNIYLLSQRADNNWLGWSDGIRIQADSVKLKVRGTVFEGFSNSGINGSYWLKADVQDCIFKNLQHSGAWFGGQPFMTGAPVALDTIKFVNNTFIANNSYSFSIRGYDNYALFEHNTMIFGTVNPFLIRQTPNLHMKNNIFYAMHAMGGNPTHVIDGWFLNYPDTASSSIIRIRGNDSVSYWSDLWNNATFTGPEAYLDETHGVTLDMLNPANRVFDVRNNAYFWPEKLMNFYQAYNDTTQTYDSITVPVVGAAGEVMRVKRTLYKPTWVSEYTQWTVDNLAGVLSPAVKIENNFEADPGFGAALMNHVDSLILYVHKISTGTIDTRWTYPNSTLYPPAWPLPEVASLAYTNAALLNAGTDGFALGDLNWFPDQKAQWLLTDVKKVDELPQGFSLSQNYPNPFNPSTEIRFAIPSQSNVELKVFNLLGQEVATLVNTSMAPGTYTVDFNASKLASGTYLYRIKAGDFVQVHKMVLMK